MNILDLLKEGVVHHDFDIVHTIKYALNGDVIHCSFTAKDKSNGVEYNVDILANTKTNRYKVETIEITDGNQYHEGDKYDMELIRSYLDNNLYYVINKVLENDSTE